MDKQLSSYDHKSTSAMRVKIASATFLITLALVIGYWFASPASFSTPVGLVGAILFTALTGWVTFGFCIAVAGVKPLHSAIVSPNQYGFSGAQINRMSGQNARDDSQASFPADRIALVVPIYNEDAAAVMACLQATAESLRRTGNANRFDIFILSDTTDPEIWVREELLWSRVRAEMKGDFPSIHYRHRVENRGRKAGNIGEFLERWGLDYKYFVILDADSTMEGKTLVELARRMDANDRLGILQAPPIPEGNESVWARTQQFAARAYGPLFNFGLVSWTGSEGNYWGHNAMIRTQAFLRHCGLSKLPGPEPLGGEVLSHDFVEAALMRRAGYEVRLAADLSGGYEQCPTTIEDHARRDQRWCQGNLQHLRIAVAPAWHPISRLHFFSGAMSYFASPLWLMFLCVGLVLHLTNDFPGNTAASIAVFSAIMTMLLLPKVLAVTVHCCGDATPYGGKLKLIGSMLVESLGSIAVAPIMMLYHSRFVILTLLGSKVRWGAQVRTDNGLALGAAIKSHGIQTSIGLTTTLLMFRYSPELLAWASPLLFGLLGAIPIGMLMASPRVGRLLARFQLLLTPEESAPPRLLRRRDVLVKKYSAEVEPLPSSTSLFVRVLSDPAFYRLHQSLLAASLPPPDGSRESSKKLSCRKLRQVRKLIRSGEIESIPKQYRRSLLSNPEALQKLHLEYWSTDQTAA